MGEKTGKNNDNISSITRIKKITMANQTSLDDETKIAARELGRRGGLKTAKKLGKKHYKKMAQKRWAAKG